MAHSSRKPISPRRRFFCWLTGFCSALILGGVALYASHAFSEEEGPLTPEQAEAEKDRVWKAMDAAGESGFERKGAPKAGEWLSSFKERPQSLERYKMTASVRPERERRTVVLQPLGAFNAEQRQVLEKMKAYAEVFFQLPARIAEPMPLPLKDAEADKRFYRSLPIGNRREGYDRQYHAGLILDEILFPKVPQDAVVYLGITMQDLYVEDLNYVFGLGSFGRRVGVYSLVRYFPEFWGRQRAEGDEKLALIRACKVLNHEAGHMFGLSHCVFYACSMNGSNSLAETDDAPIHFCPVCHRKLRWNIAFDAAKRYEALAAFYAEHGLQDEAAWVKARLETWKKISAKENGVEDE